MKSCWRAFPGKSERRWRCGRKQLIREEKVRRSTVPRRPITKRGIERETGLPRQLERLENRADMPIGVLRRQVEAMRGKLRLVVEIEGRRPVELKRLGSRAPAVE